MTLSYGLRLSCLLLIVTGLVCVALQCILSRSAPVFLRWLEGAAARRRERVLYLLQLAPALLALFVAGALCLPEYLRHEPIHEAEPVGWITLLLAAAAAIWFGSAWLRGARLTMRTLRFAGVCRRTGRVIDPAGPPILAIAHGSAPPLALVGFLRPFVVISADLLARGVLHPEALQVALDHERSHALHLDNWKLLSLCFLPRLFGDPWRSHWQAAADWAADDDAVSGDPARSLLLADALVRTARLVGPSSSAIICAALTRSERGLALRIGRLLRPRPASGSMGNSLLPGFAALVFLTAGSAAAALPWIYRFSEHLLHLGGF